MAADPLTVPETDAAADDGQQPVSATPPQGAPARPQRPAMPSAPSVPDIQGAAYVAANRDPERHARVVDMATRLHLSPAFVDQNYDDLAKTVDQSSTQDQMASVSPTLRNWLSNPDNASIAKKEIAPLSQIDTGAKLLVPTPRIDQADGPIDALGTATATGMADLAVSAHLLGAAFGHQTPQEAAQAISAAIARREVLRAEAPSYAQEYATAIQQHEGDLNAARSAVLATGTDTAKAGILNALVEFGRAASSATPMNPAAARTLGETLSLIGAHVSSLNRLKGFLYQNVEGLASMAPMLASGEAGSVGGGLVGSVVPGVGTVVGGVAGGMAGTFAGAAVVNVGSEIEQALAKRGVDLHDPQAVERALSDPQVMASVRGMALKAGLTSAGVMTLMQGFGGVLGARAAQAEGTAAKVALKAGAVATPAVGVAAGTEAGAVAKGEPVDPARAIATTLQMLAFGGATEAIGASRRALLSPETHAAAAELSGQTADALRAQHDAQVLTETARAVQDAPTTASVPDRLKDMIHTATGGPDAAHVYFQTDDWNRYWDGQGKSPVEAAAAVMGDEGKAYHDAQTTGARLAIPLADYLTEVAPTPHFDGLLDVARTRPDGMSFAEARDHLENVPATMRDLADEATRQAAGDASPLEHSAQQVRQDVEQQLTAAGVGPVAAKAQAQIYESAFRTLGARAKVSARELFNRYGLTIGRGPLEPTPEALATMEAARTAAQAAAGATPANEARASTLYQGMPEVGPRPRTASGRLKDVRKMDPYDLAVEYRTLTDLNARPEAKPEDIAARAQTLGKLEAEMGRRGMDPKEAYMAGSPALGPAPEGSFYARRMLEMGRQRASELGLPSSEAATVDMDGYVARTLAIGKQRAAELEGSGMRPAGSEQAVPLQSLMDRARSGPNLLANLFVGQPLSPEGDRLLSAPSLESVVAKVRAAARVNPEIFRSIIRAVPVDVVHNLFGSERAAESALRNEPVLKDRSTLDADLSVAKPIDAAGPVGLFLREVALQATKAPFMPRGAGGESTEGARAPFTAKDSQGVTYFQSEPKASITLNKGDVKITLGKYSDRSSLLHETGHLYLEVLGDLASAKGASDDLKADYQTIRDWVGAEGDTPLTVEQHEQVARGFEAYLMEGKAPSAELRSAFYRFKNWLVGIYKNLTALNVQLTPEVRQVFDRMLASQEEIAAAEQDGHAAPLFMDLQAAGMTDEQAARYTKAAHAAHEAAESQLTTDLMKQIRREESKEWQAQRKPIEDEVTKDVQARPVYKALAYLMDHTNSDGSPLPDGAPPLSISKAALVGAYGKDILNGMPRGTVSTEGGVHPDVVADMFGFQNGRELVDALRASPPMADAIRAETDAHMQDVYGDRMTDADVKAKATAAINGEARGTLLRLEAEHLYTEQLRTAKALTKAVTAPVVPDAVLKQRASEIIGGTKVRAIRPDLFEHAVARAGKDAVDRLLAGDILGAAQAKAQQRLARAVADAATTAKAQQEIAFERFKKVFRADAKLEKTRDLSFVNGARSLLASLGIGASDKGAASYLESVKEYAPDAYENVQAITEDLRALGVTDYRDLTGDQFQELHDTVRQLWTLSRKAKQVVLENQAQDLDTVLQPIVQNVLARNVERIATRGRARALTVTDKVEGAVLSATASLRRAESLGRALDGLDVVHGPLSRVIREVLHATDSYRVHKTDVTERLAKAAEVLDGLPKQRDIAAPELKGYTFRDMKELLGAMLHTGNREGATSNFTKLLVGRGWGAVDDAGVVDATPWDHFVTRLQQTGVLTKAHYDWLQSSWDFFEELKPQLQHAYFDVNGRYMKEVAHTPFSTPFGEYAGGYYPAIGDTHVAGGAEIDNAMRASEDALLGTDNKFLFTQPASGMTKTRTGKTWPLVMDASQLPRHLDAVLKYLHMAAPVREVFKVFNHRDFREAMGGINPAMVNDALIPFLRAASSQRSAAPATTALGKALSDATTYITAGALQQVTGANLVILAEQILHTSAIQSMRTPDNKAMVYYHDVAGAAAKILFSPKKLTDWIHEQSPAVAMRDQSRLQKAQSAFDAVLNPSPLRTVQETVAHSVDVVGHLMNAMMDKAVWLGAYDRATQRGIAANDAVHYADAVVRQGLGGHHPEDLSQVQRSTPLVKAMLGLYGFFNAKANQLGTDAFAQTVTDMGLQRSKSRMAAVYVMGLLAMSVSGAAARDVIGGRKRKEDETWGDTLGEWAGWGQLEALGRMVPGGNVALQSLEMFFHKPGATADNMLSSPAANVFPNLVGNFRAAGRVVRGEPVTSKDIKDVLGLFGTLTHLPAKVLARPIAYGMDVQAGKAQPTSALDEIRGYLTGTGSR